MLVTLPVLEEMWQVCRRNQNHKHVQLICQDTQCCCVIVIDKLINKEERWFGVTTLPDDAGHSLRFAAIPVTEIVDPSSWNFAHNIRS